MQYIISQVDHSKLTTYAYYQSAFNFCTIFEPRGQKWENLLLMIARIACPIMLHFFHQWKLTDYSVHILTEYGYIDFTSVGMKRVDNYCDVENNISLRGMRFYSIIWHVEGTTDDVNKTTRLIFLRMEFRKKERKKFTASTIDHILAKRYFKRVCKNLNVRLYIEFLYRQKILTLDHV